MALFDYKEIQQDLEVVDRNVKVLEQKYTDFCDNIISREPKELRAQTEFLVKKWWGKPIPNAKIRFRIQNTVQRFNMYKEKWDRQLRNKIKKDREEVEYL